MIAVYNITVKFERRNTMEKKFAEIINEGKKDGKTIEEINKLLKEAGANFHLNADGGTAGWTEAEMAAPPRRSPRMPSAPWICAAVRIWLAPSRSSGSPAASSRLPMTRTVMPKAR